MHPHTDKSRKIGTTILTISFWAMELQVLLLSSFGLSALSVFKNNN